ncbi:sensor histidine kinase [Sulfitobacter sp.]|uniref:sensor histidine kinase n=1 Tax=Sulfitobacter sp. TaxID=1903071 RepID=UPI003003833C
MTRTAALVETRSSGPPQDDPQNIDDFIYLMSHDLRASVRALLELPNWISEDLQEAAIDLPASVTSSIELMNRHTARLDQMLVDLLAYSRIGRFQDVDRVDLDAALSRVLEGLQLPEGLRVLRDINCTHAMLGEQDALLLLSALIDNTTKHHHAATSRVKISTRAEGSMIRLTVSDDGPGIPEKYYAKALGALSTLRPRDEVEGTGMGLANVNRIAEHYGGYMTLSPAQDSETGLEVDVVFPHGCDETK